MALVIIGCSNLEEVLINPECIDICHREEQSDVAISAFLLEATA